MAQTTLEAHCNCCAIEILKAVKKKFGAKRVWLEPERRVIIDRTVDMEKLSKLLQKTGKLVIVTSGDNVVGMTHLAPPPPPPPSPLAPYVAAPGSYLLYAGNPWPPTQLNPYHQYVQGGMPTRFVGDDTYDGCCSMQ